MRNRFHTRLLVATIALSLLALVGCSGGSKVEGNLKHKGALIANAQIQVFNNDVLVASAKSDANGHFKLVDPKGKDLIPSGTYTVTVSKDSDADKFDASKLNSNEGKFDKEAMDRMIKMPKKGEIKQLLPTKFMSTKDSTLKITIPANGPIELDLGE